MQSYRPITLLLTVLSLFGCANEVDFGIKGVVLSSGRMSLIKDGSYPSPYWTPSNTQVQDLTDQLLRFLQGSDHPIDRAILDNLDQYQGQYLGFTDDRGQRLLLLNAYCPAMIDEHSPRISPAMWLDGPRTPPSLRRDL